VQIGGQQFLADAAFATDQYRHAHRGDTLDRAPDALHLLRGAK